MNSRTLAIIGTWLKVALFLLILSWVAANWVMDPVIDGEIQTESRLRDLY
ncbi:MAG TPA: hypothetical protein VJ437_06260 [Acidiferrobacterales bacterium]|nr:hypothetical protein [Acidiferrobacterales bacterium]